MRANATSSHAVPRFPLRMRARILLAAWCFLVLAAASGAMPVSAHAGLLEADPAPNSVVTRAPSVITLTFDEPPQPGYTRVTIYDASQRPVATVKDPSPGTSPTTLLVAVPDLRTDSYAVVWQVLSQDGHIAKGVFVFTLQLPGDARPAEIQPGLDLGASNDPPVLSVILSAIRYAGLSALVGGTGIVLLCLLPALTVIPQAQRISVRHDLEAKAQKWLFVAFGFALGAHVLILVTQVAKVNGISLLDALRYDALTSLLKNTTFGAVWRVQALVLLGLGEWLVLLPATARVRLPSLRPRLGITANASHSEQMGQTDMPVAPIPLWAWGITLVAGLFLLGAQIFGGHAIDVPTHPALSMLADWGHLVAISLWFGGVLLLVGLAPVLWVGVPAEIRQRARAMVISRFSNLALVAVGVFIVTGVYNATEHTSRPTLTTTGYGLAILGKSALVLCIVLVAAVNRYVLQPRFIAGTTDGRVNRAYTLLSRLVAVEVVLGVVVIAVTGLLTQLPPAYKTPPPIATSTAATPAPSEVVVSIPTLAANGVRSTLSLYSQGPNVDFDALVTDGTGNTRSDVQRVTLWLRSGDRDVGLVTVPLNNAGGGHYKAGGPYFAVGQHWLAQLVVRRMDVAEDVVLPFAIEPRPVAGSDYAPATSLAFPWPHFEQAALLGLLLIALGVGVLVATRSARLRFGTRERLLYQYGGAVVIVVGLVVTAWFSTIAVPLVR